MDALQATLARARVDLESLASRKSSVCAEATEAADAAYRAFVEAKLRLCEAERPFQEEEERLRTTVARTEQFLETMNCVATEREVAFQLIDGGTAEKRYAYGHPWTMLQRVFVWSRFDLVWRHPVTDECGVWSTRSQSLRPPANLSELKVYDRLKAYDIASDASLTPKEKREKLEAVFDAFL